MVRDPYTWIGVLAMAGLLGTGAYFYWQSLPPRPSGGRLFGEAYIVGLVIGFHSGCARDRQYNFDRYIVANFVTPASLYFGRLLCALAFLLAYGISAFLCALAYSRGDVGYAAHYTQLLFLASLVMLPMVVAIELVLNTRMPVAILVILFFVFLMVYGRSHDPQNLMRVLGFTEKVTFGGVALRTLIALAVSALLFPLFWWRLGRVSLTRSV
jgi:hypothetical protein